MNNSCIKDNIVILKKQGEKSTRVGRKYKNMNKGLEDFFIYVPGWYSD